MSSQKAEKLSQLFALSKKYFPLQYGFTSYFFRLNIYIGLTQDSQRIFHFLYQDQIDKVFHKIYKLLLVLGLLLKVCYFVQIRNNKFLCCPIGSFALSIFIASEKTVFSWSLLITTFSFSLKWLSSAKTACLICGFPLLFFWKLVGTSYSKIK